MTLVFSIMSSFLYMVIFHVVALHPVYHRITLPPTSSCPLSRSSSFCFHPPCPKPRLEFGSVFSPTDFINLLQIHILNDSSRWMSTLILNVHVSAAYNTVLQIRVLAILFFNSDSIFPLSNSPRSLDSSFPMAIRHFTSIQFSSLHLISFFDSHLT